MNHNYETMERSELVGHLKRLKHEESEIRAEGHRMIEKAVAPVMAELEIVRDHLNLQMTNKLASFGVTVQR